MYGKNIVDQNVLLNASGWTLNDEGFYTGSNTALYNAFSKDDKYLFSQFDSTKQYTISMDFYSPSAASIYVSFYYSDGTYSKSTSKSTICERVFLTSTVGKKITKAKLSYGSSGLVFLKNLQLEASTAMTEFEPHKESQTATIDTETQTGWEELKTYYPVTNIIPTQSATIDCTYVADTKNYIDNKLAELTALTLEG